MNRALGLIVTGLLLLGGVSVARAETPPSETPPPLTVEPKDDAFYMAPGSAEDLAAAAPGDILRVRPLSLTAFGFPIPLGGWQLLVRSTDSAGRPVAIVTSVILPDGPYAGTGPRPLLSYQMAIDALGDQCMPSYTLRAGTQKEAPTLLPALEAGWAVVTTDFEGPRHAYGAGPMAGHAVLDGIRAATKFEPTGLNAQTPVGLMGYSGGGQATTWAAELQPAYAPELNVVGIAGGGVPADLNVVARHLDGRLEAGIGVAAAFGINREFPSMLDGLLNDHGRQVEQAVGDQCIEDFAFGYPSARFADLTNVSDPLALPQVTDALAANSLGKATPTAPFYLYHSVADQLIPVAVADRLAQQYCDESDQPVFYDRNAGGDHIGYAFTGGVTAFAFLASRFAGVPAPDNCAVVPVIASAPGATTTAPAAPKVSAAADHPGRAYGTNPPAGANDWTCAPSAAHPNPIVLVHGLGATAQANWFWMAPKLAAAGYCVFAIDYGHRSDVPPPFTYNGGIIPMEASAEQLALFVDAVRDATGAAKVDIVGHSEGSLMPNYYVKFLGGAAYVDRYVGITPLWDGTNLFEAGTFTELGRPSGGTDMFNDLFFGNSCQSCPQFIQGSDFLVRMNEGPTGPRVEGVTYTMVMTKYDELVQPYTSGIMDGATNLVVQDQCANDISEHGAMAGDPVVLRDVLNALDPAHAQPVNCGAGLTFIQ